MTEKQRHLPAGSLLTGAAVHSAMLSSLEGYVSAVVDSVEFELRRPLSDGEHQYVYDTVETAITRILSHTDSGEVSHG